MLPIVRSLCEKTNDVLIIKEYTRLAPLKVRKKALGSFRHVEPGDCVVGFSRKGLYDIKRSVESANPGIRCCVI
jgi:ATP-dependent RNA helicase SUPV3L1/SUV3